MRCLSRGDAKKIGRGDQKRLGSREPVHLSGETGYFSGGLPIMNDALGRGFLNDRNGLGQGFFGLFGRIIGYCRSHFFHRVLNPGFVTDIS